MTYVTVHRSKIRFQVVIATILVLAFFLALILMFVHPTASLTVFFSEDVEVRRESTQGVRGFQALGTRWSVCAVA